MNNRHGPEALVFSEEEAHRVVDAAWGVQHLLPHPDDVGVEDAARLREFHRSISKIPPIKRGPGSILVEPK